MSSLRILLMLLFSIAIAMAGMPAYAGSDCVMKSGTQLMVKDCPNCTEKSHGQAQHNKCCGSADCAIGCCVAASMNATADITVTFMPVVHTLDTAYPSDDTLFSFFTQTQERPPKHFA